MNIRRTCYRISMKLNRCLYRNKIKDKNVELDAKAYVDYTNYFEGNNRVIGDTYLHQCYIGKGTYIESGGKLNKTKIGRYCSVGPYVQIIDGNHPSSTYVSTYPALYRKGIFSGLDYGADSSFEEYSYTDNEKRWYCEIGNDVWIGHSVAIINGCKIGDGAIIAAGAVVTKDVAPYSIVGGVPAKVIRFRFEDDDINFLLKLKWWDKSDEWIKHNINSFYNIKEFRRRIDDF